jgi:hypothetical protein
MRNRYRWINQITGLPGWIRYGFTPGWCGRRNLSNRDFFSRYVRYSIPPHLQSTTIKPQIQTPFSTKQSPVLPGFTSLYDPWGMSVLTPKEELNFMKVEAEQLEDQLYAIEKRIKELEEKE